MNDEQFRALLDMVMCSDPWPIEDGGNNQELVTDLLEREATNRGFSDWITAYHHFDHEWPDITPETT